MVTKKFFAIALLCAFFYGCDILESQQFKTDSEENMDKRIYVYKCDLKTKTVWAVWPARDRTDTVEYPMFGDLSIEELNEDLLFAVNENACDSLTGILDVSTKSVIGWDDANGDDENYRLMIRASWGLLTEALIKKYLE